MGYAEHLLYVLMQQRNFLTDFAVELADLQVSPVSYTHLTLPTIA